jgi:CRP/FNR family transcriptional regulator
MEHQSYSQAMETAMVCKIPFTTLDELSGKLPKLRLQMMSSEINYDQEMLLLLNKKNSRRKIRCFYL